MYIIYGINNCGTIRKTKKWFDEQGIEYQFHDYKKMGISKEKVEEWLQQVSIDDLINKRGTTWRKLDENQKTNIQDKESGVSIILENNSVVKRPIIEKENRIEMIGYDESVMETLK